MVEESSQLEPALRREIMQAINSHYYNVTDGEGRAVGGLLVLLDRRNRPVRAEIHLHDELPDDVASTAVRQGYHILGERYFGDEPLPLQVRESYALGETLRVTLGDPALAEDEPRRWPLWQIASAAVMIIVLVSLIWAISTWLRGGSSGAAETPTVQDQNVATPISDAAASPVLPTPTTNGQLPPSRNADTTLAIGDKVRIKPGYTLTLRSEAGAEAGKVVGYMKDGDIAEIIDGPILLQGDSDTIVWWLVKLPDNTQAWAAANTSTAQLLERA